MSIPLRSTPSRRRHSPLLSCLSTQRALTRRAFLSRADSTHRGRRRRGILLAWGGGSNGDGGGGGNVSLPTAPLKAKRTSALPIAHRFLVMGCPVAERPTESLLFSMDKTDGVT